MKSHTINGYLVVRVAGARRYRGVDREPWDTVDSAYFAQALPPEMRYFYQDVRDAEKRGFWWPTAESLEAAEKMLAFSQSREPDTELIAVFSPYIEQTIGRRAWAERGARLLGIDVISVGEWSLLGKLECASGQLPGPIAALINEAGLLRHADDADVIAEHYRRVAGQGLVETIASADSGIPVEPVWVYTVER